MKALLLLLCLATTSFAASKTLKPSETQAEVMISRSEMNAIHALQSIIKKNPDNPELWLRLAELYTRKSKTSRFFELSRDSAEKAASLSLVGDLDKNAKADLKMAMQIYDRILKDFPKFAETDTVLFHAGFTSLQLDDKNLANQYNLRLVTDFPKSKYIPDAYLALAEAAYEAQNFSQAEKYFSELKSFPGAKVYAYGLYKLGWSLYNQKKNEQAIQTLVKVVQLFSDQNPNSPEQKHNLRPEALRDLSLFYGETHSAEEAYRFFSQMCTPAELADALLQLGKLYLAHNREKEMTVFLSDLISQNPTPQTLVRAHLLLAEANEHLKKTVQVASELAAVSAICQKEKLTECNENFTHYTHELSHRWWDQWIKTKKDTNLAGSVREVLQLRLKAEDSAHSDFQAHLLLADLLFQLGEFRQASESYEWISTHASDAQMKEEALYSAIASLQKLGENLKADSPVNDVQAKTLLLTDTFLKTYPHSKQLENIQFKRAFTFYSLKNDNEAEKIFKPLATSSADKEIQQKSQDLLLDILNRNQRFTELKEASLTYAQNAPETRIQGLKKVSAEAAYSDVQKQNEKSSAKEKFDHLMAYYKSQPLEKELGYSAVYQALALAYGSGLEVDGAFASLEYAKNKHDDKAVKALSDATVAFLENGFFEEGLHATEALIELTTKSEQLKWQRLRTDIYFLLGKNKEALTASFDLAGKMDTKERSQLYGDMYLKFKNTPRSDEYARISKKIMDDDIEPFSSEQLVTRAQNLLAEKKYADAFHLSKQIMGKKTSDLNRAHARLIQAEILQKEFFDQSLRTTLAKLDLVLGLKTEKLEKTQEAFVNAQKISADPDIQKQSLRGLRESYAHYIESLKSLRLKNDLAEVEQKSLEAAINGIVTPMTAKLKDLDLKLSSFAKSQASDTLARVDYETLAPDAVWTPSLPNLNFAKTESNFFPVEFKNQKQFVHDLNAGKFSGDLSLGKRLAQENPKSFEGVFYQATTYLRNHDYEKSDYLFSVLSRKSEFKKEASYYKGILEYRRGNLAQAQVILADAYKQGVEVKETRIAALRSLYAQKDFFQFNVLAKSTSLQDLQDHHLLAPFAETLANAGDTQTAWEIILGDKAISTDGELMKAHLAENFEFDFVKAQRFYEIATKRPDLDGNIKNWLSRKIEWLKNPRKIASAGNAAAKEGANP